jgi:hypothetical protein
MHSILFGPLLSLDLNHDIPGPFRVTYSKRRSHITNSTLTFNSNKFSGSNLNLSFTASKSCKQGDVNESHKSVYESTMLIHPYQRITVKTCKLTFMLGSVEITAGRGRKCNRRMLIITLAVRPYRTRELVKSE